MNILKTMLTDIFQSLYQIFGISLLVAILFMFAYLYCKEHGVREGLKAWLDGLKAEQDFRRMFLLALYVAMILCKTLFCRKIWEQPFKNVIGTWGLYEDGKLYTENIENFILFWPYLALLLWALQGQGGKKDMTGKELFRLALPISFGSSLFIELMQLFLKVGAIQLSDLFFNTLGGLFGALTYWIWYRHQQNRKAG